MNARKSNKYFSFYRDFKICRLFAISSALAIQIDCAAHLRVKRSALLLTAACVWLFNGLCERPEDGPSWRRLMDVVLPITDFEKHEHLAYRAFTEDNELSVGTPYYPYGITFLRPIHFRKGTNTAPPRLKTGGPFLPVSATEELFGETEEKIRHRHMVQERFSFGT
jgi:hypothetical protein